jgi:hypothetical protein
MESENTLQKPTRSTMEKRPKESIERELKAVRYRIRLISDDLRNACDKEKALCEELRES